MKLFSKKEVFIWALIALTVVNVALLATIVWRLQKKTPVITHEKFEVRKGDSLSKERGWQWKKEIGLSDEQHTKIMELRKQYKEKTSALMESMKQKQAQIFEELYKDSPNKQKLDSLADETGLLHSQMRKESILHILDIKAISTPEQQQRMKEFMEKRLPRVEHGKLFRVNRSPVKSN